MDYESAKRAWAEQLELAESFLQTDPTAARDAHRTVLREVEHAMRMDPEANAALEPMLCRARVALSHSERASARFESDAVARERRFRQRETQLSTLPLAQLRRPWPPPDVSG